MYEEGTGSVACGEKYKRWIPAPLCGGTCGLRSSSRPQSGEQHLPGQAAQNTRPHSHTQAYANHEAE